MPLGRTMLSRTALSAGHPQVRVEDRHDEDAVGPGVLDQVLADEVVASAGHEDARRRTPGT